MMFKIGKVLIGSNQRCAIVAELSGNHGGDFKRIKKLITEAKKSGADLIKLQTYTPDTITLNSDKKDFQITKKTPWKKNKNLWSLYNKAQTPRLWHKEIFKLCKKINIDVFSSPFDEEAVDMLEDLNCPAYKIASAEITHIPLIEKIAKTKKPVILSIGLANLPDINLAIKTLKKNGSKHICILQCVSSYPSPLNEQNLSLIPLIKKKFGLVSGLSDHTTGITTALTSVALGASIIEKHFKLDDRRKTVDSFFSLGGLGFKEMIKEIRNVESAIGNAKFQVSKSSKKNLNSRRSIYISGKIKKGEKITLKNIKVVRPSFGLHPKYFKKVLGKKINKTLNLGDRLKLEHISKN
jgi:pseudaminic acid synthase